MAAFSAAERRAIARALQAGDRPECPHCGAALTRRDVTPSAQVSYVRRRVWLLCPDCKRTGAVDAPDVKGGGPP